MTASIDADYLVVGAGAMGMAFADTLVAETSARVAIVDRYHQPGGHWTLAYPFVRLHQPSIGYGVDSRRLGADAIDRAGWNAGLLELANVGEICAYFEQVMQHTLLASGRVEYRPMTDHLGHGRCRSRVTGEVWQAPPDCRIVDAKYQNVTVPAMRAPPYAVADGVRCVPPNGIVDLRDAPARFTIVGAGKTGMDACLWLLRHGVDPDRLTWVMPRDSWLIDRALTQPDPRFAERIATVLIGQLQAVEAASTARELFDRLEACGRLIRLDPAVRPTMYRCATVSTAELEQLRRVRDVVRLGRVRRIEPDLVVLDGGQVPAAPSTLYVDCSADGLATRPAVPVFNGRTITLQSVRTCQQVFSAALIARVEASGQDEAAKNRLCRPVPHPDTDMDFVRTTIADSRAERVWGADPALRPWLERSRLNWVRDLGPPLPAEPEARREALEMRYGILEHMADKLERFQDSSAPSRPDAVMEAC